MSSALESLLAAHGFDQDRYFPKRNDSNSMQTCFPTFFCQTKYSLCEDLGRVAEESPGALTTPMRQFVGTPDLSILSKPAVGSLTINHPGHVAWKFAHWGCLLVG